MFLDLHYEKVVSLGIFKCFSVYLNFNDAFYFGCAGVIKVLVNSGRQIDAVNLAFAFDLTEQFSPIPLLKSYLNDAKKISSPVKSVNSSPTAQVNSSVSATYRNHSFCCFLLMI